jgi:H/ACA ribonucleoprotein complex subunit 4
MRGPPSERTPAERLQFGVVNIDKPPGPSAHQVADWVREFANDALESASAARGGTDDQPLHINRVAHAGTLDPKVTGSLPMLLGTAARLARVFDDAIKEYVAVLELHGPAPSDFGAVLAEFEGRIYQRPPRKSAVRRTRREREIYGIEVLQREQRRALLRIRCEAGTYIRKLCHDIGLALGTGAHMGDLRRTATGGFDDSALVSMETYVDALGFWIEDGDLEPISSAVEPAERALVGLPRVTIAPDAARAVSEGAPVYAPGVIGVGPALAAAPGDAVPLADPPSDYGDLPIDEQLVGCYTPEGAAVCLGRLVGDYRADSGTVVSLERVLV